MPYTINSENLPSYIKKLSDDIKAKWVTIFNSVYEKEGEKIALIAANKWLQRGIKKTSVEGKSDNALFIERITLELGDKQLIKQTADGEEYVDFVMTDTGADTEGNKYPESLIKRWTDKINSGESFIGDIDHKEYDEILINSSTVDEAAELIKNTKKGIAKTVKAYFDKGRMWVRAIIDKRYKKIIERAKGVSLEAIVSRNLNGEITDGDLLGFTFAVDQRPKNPRAVIV